MTTTSGGPPGDGPKNGPRAERPRAAPPLRLSLTVACVVLLIAELAVRLVQPALAAPNVWPQPELQKKYAQLAALGHSPQPPDVVLVGDSGMDAGGDPDALNRLDPGLHSYNGSVAGAVLPEIADWTTRIVVPRLHPRVVVIGLSSNELNPHALGAASTVAYQHSRVVRAASGTGNPVDLVDSWLRHWSVLYRYRTILRDPVTGTASPPGVFDPVLTSSGQDLAFSDQAYLEKGGPAGAQLVLAGVKAALKDFSVSPVNVGILQRMIASLRHRGIDVVLVAMPVTQEAVALHPAGDADYQLAMETLSGTATRADIPFLQPGIWPTPLFADPVHLNAAGSAKFSIYLADALRAQRRAPPP